VPLYFSVPLYYYYTPVSLYCCRIPLPRYTSCIPVSLLLVGYTCIPVLLLDSCSTPVSLYYFCTHRTDIIHVCLYSGTHLWYPESLYYYCTNCISVLQLYHCTTELYVYSYNPVLLLYPSNPVEPLNYSCTTRHNIVYLEDYENILSYKEKLKILENNRTLLSSS